MNRSLVITSALATAVGGLGLTALTTTAAAGASAAPPRAAAVATCTLRLVSTKAVNLQHDATGTDQLRARLGNTTTRTRSYTVGQRRNTLSDGTETFSDETRISLQVEVLGGAWLTIDSRGVDCEDRTRDLVVANGDSRYKMRAILAVVP
ncbi:hypothetical protein [Nocardioides sambongensis]|uniref:hypothetical protein n=1 Tax=Nocardioides sambongensis TaxID=2589074 RepID=UPI00112C8BC9|nr:hypothetical protein [Nocardioides sambongensis]